MPDNGTARVTEHSSRLQPSIKLHASVTTFMFSCSGNDILPRRDEGSGKPCAEIKLYSTLAPTRALNSDARIHSLFIVYTDAALITLHWNLNMRDLIVIYSTQDTNLEHSDVIVFMQSHLNVVNIGWAYRRWNVGGSSFKARTWLQLLLMY